MNSAVGPDLGPQFTSNRLGLALAADRKASAEVRGLFWPVVTGKTGAEHARGRTLRLPLTSGPEEVDEAGSATGLLAGAVRMRDRDQQGGAGAWLQ